MRKKWLITAVFMALTLSACGSQAGESGGNSVGASAEGTANAGDPADGTAEILKSEADQAGTSVAAGNVPEASGQGAEQAEISGTGAGASGQEEGIVAQQEGSAGTIRVTLPEGWTYDLCPEGSVQLRMGDYGIHFYPEGVSEGFIELCYTEFFGVCGTGLEEKVINLAGDQAKIGTYDNHEQWDFVSFRGINKGIVALSYAVEDWWPEYGEQALEILDTVSLIRDSGNGTEDICGYPLAPQSAGAVQTIACGTNQEPSESPGEGSVIEELGLSLEIMEYTGTGATLVFRQSGGNPSGELQYGSEFSIEKYEDGTWIQVPVAVEGNYAFTMEAYNIPQDGDREFQIDWEWLYGELAPGEYRIVKSVDDFRKPADYDQYKIYAYFEIHS